MVAAESNVCYSVIAQLGLQESPAVQLSVEQYLLWRYAEHIGHRDWGSTWSWVTLSPSRDPECWNLDIGTFCGSERNDSSSLAEEDDYARGGSPCCPTWNAMLKTMVVFPESKQQRSVALTTIVDFETSAERPSYAEPSTE